MKVPMKQLIVLTSLILSTTASAWWSPIEAIRVTCAADQAIFPEYGNINISGSTVEIEKGGEVHVYPARVWQSHNSKVWESTQVTLYVALKQSSWWNYHVGNLTVMESPRKEIPLWCKPKLSE